MRCPGVFIFFLTVTSIFILIWNLCSFLTFKNLASQFCLWSLSIDLFNPSSFPVLKGNCHDPVSLLFFSWTSLVLLHLIKGAQSDRTFYCVCVCVRPFSHCLLTEAIISKEPWSFASKLIQGMGWIFLALFAAGNQGEAGCSENSYQPVQRHLNDSHFIFFPVFLWTSRSTSLCLQNIKF